jgi:hypothetical protein
MVIYLSYIFLSSRFGIVFYLYWYYARSATVTAKPTAAVKLEDIQAGALEPRPVPYAGVYHIVRIDLFEAQEFLSKI